MTTNIDPTEVAKFDNLASDWWDKAGSSKPLHDINPARLQFIASQCPLSTQHAIDIGCGGGILTEGLAEKGAICHGIDMSESAIDIAKSHATASALTIDYQVMTAETLAQTSPQQYDIVTCMEMLEHVPDPASVIHACSQLVKPGGHVFFSTLNRHPKAYLFAVLGAEYLLNLLPKGTHDYQRFIRPSEMAAWCRQANLAVSTLQGISYQPLNKTFHLSDDLKVNYLMHCTRLA